ncbi:MAG: hypothetical protein HOQ34_07850 [Gemmatimonadaceae bacterium]|nr:hypothetical protein [Gemmatimonadaceae bacterium]
MESLNQQDFAAAIGLSTRQIRNLEEAGCPVRVKGDRKTYPWPKALHWYIAYKVERAEAAAKPLDFEAARARKMEADANLAEIEVAKAQAALVPTETVDSIVGELGDRLRAVIVNIPGNYGLKLEELGVDPKAAEAVLTTISEEITRALRAVADELDDEADRGDSGSTDSSSDSTAPAGR